MATLPSVQAPTKRYWLERGCWLALLSMRALCCRASCALHRLSHTIAALPAHMQIYVVDVQSNRACFVCGVIQSKMTACSGCKLAAYCSRACQRADWPAHKIACQATVEQQKRPLQVNPSYQDGVRGTSQDIGVLLEQLHVRPL